MMKQNYFKIIQIIIYFFSYIKSGRIFWFCFQLKLPKPLIIKITHFYFVVNNLPGKDFISLSQHTDGVFQFVYYVCCKINSMLVPSLLSITVCSTKKLTNYFNSFSIDSQLWKTPTIQQFAYEYFFGIKGIYKKLTFLVIVMLLSSRLFLLG
jgi:hypothetical protein